MVQFFPSATNTLSASVSYGTVRAFSAGFDPTVDDDDDDDDDIRLELREREGDKFSR